MPKKKHDWEVMLVGEFVVKSQCKKCRGVKLVEVGFEGLVERVRYPAGYSSCGEVRDEANSGQEKPA